jgi:hypothetical protein
MIEIPTDGHAVKAQGAMPALFTLDAISPLSARTCLAEFVITRMPKIDFLTLLDLAECKHADSVNGRRL